MAEGGGGLLVAFNALLASAGEADEDLEALPHILNRLAALLEQEERKFQNEIEDPWGGSRDDHSIGPLLNQLVEADAFIELLTTRYLDASHGDAINLAAARLLLVACPAETDLIESALSEEAQRERWQAWAMQEKKHAQRVIGTGLIAQCLNIEQSERSQWLAQHIVGSGLNAVLYKRLRLLVLGDGEPPANGASSSSLQPAPELPRRSPRAGPSAAREAAAGRSSPAVAGEDGAAAEEEGLSPKHLREMELHALLQVLARTGEYQEVIAPAFQERVLDVLFALLKSPDKTLMNAALKLIHSLLTHRKFAAAFVDKGGVQLLLAAPRITYIAGSLGVAFHGLAATTSVFERVCQLPHPTCHTVVKVGLWLLSSPSDTARKNGAVFFSLAFSFRAVLDFFDSMEGPRYLLALLRPPAPPPGADPAVLDPPRVSKELALPAMHALRQYLRGHLVVLAESLRRRGPRHAPPAAAPGQPSPAPASAAKARLAAAGPAAATAAAGPAASSLPPPYKAMDLDPDAAQAAIAALEKLRAAGTPVFTRQRFPATQALVDLGGTPLVLKVIQTAVSRGWNAEIAHSGLEVLQLVTLVPVGQASLINAALDNGQAGMAVVLDSASGGQHQDPEIIKAALRVVCNCVCRPVGPSPAGPGPSFAPGPAGHAAASCSTAAPQAGGHAATPAQPAPTAFAARLSAVAGPSASGPSSNPSSGPPPGAGPPPGPGPSAGGGRGPKEGKGEGLVELREEAAGRLPEETQRQAWEAVRANNGIRLLLSLLRYRNSLVHSDGVRSLACAALLGLARDPTILQILGSLQTSQLLSNLLREPVSADRAADFAAFKASALELIARVTGKGTAAVTSEAQDPTLRKIEKASIVAHTRIAYPAQELLQLIHRHLLAHGLSRAAAALADEASLPPPPPLSLLTSPHILAHHAPFLPTATPSARPPSPPHGPLPSDTPMRGLPSSTPFLTATPQHPHLHIAAPPHHAGPSHAAPALTPLHPPPHPAVTPARPPYPFGATACPPGSPSPPPPPPPLNPAAPPVTLDSIVTQYLRQQHRECPDPIAVLPPFCLLQPHTCPPKPRDDGRRAAPPNAALRFLRRNVAPPRGGAGGAAKDRRLVFSRFRPLRALRDAAQGATIYTCAAFVDSGTPGRERLLAGTMAGEMKLFDVRSAEHLETYPCHDRELWAVRASPDGRTVVTVASGETRVWSFRPAEGSGERATLASRFALEGLREAALSNNSERIAGILNRRTVLHRADTGAVLASLEDVSGLPGQAAHALPGVKAHTGCVAFSPGDELVLADAVLWDPRLPRIVHRFDKLTSFGSGCFHPAGHQVLINSEVWDLRTFKLLRSCPAFEQSYLVFSAAGDVVYSLARQYEKPSASGATPPRARRNPFGTTFRTVDAVDYGLIATVELERHVLDLAVDRQDDCVALVENAPSDSAVKLYEVGRRRAAEADSDPEDSESEGDAPPDDESDDMSVDGGSRHGSNGDEALLGTISAIVGGEEEEEEADGAVVIGGDEDEEEDEDGDAAMADDSDDDEEEGGHETD